MADVIGYEEKNPATVEAMTAGYPRFKLPEYVERLTNLIAKEISAEPRDVLLLNSEKAAGDLLNYLDEPAAKVESEEDYAFVHFPAEPDAYAHAFKFLQHTGCGISSRQAEDILFAQGHIETSFQEDLYEGDAEAEVDALAGVRIADLFVGARHPGAPAGDAETDDPGARVRQASIAFTPGWAGEFAVRTGRRAEAA